jgi:hypothetical protein
VSKVRRVLGCDQQVGQLRYSVGPRLIMALGYKVDAEVGGFGS